MLILLPYAEYILIVNFWITIYDDEILYYVCFVRFYRSETKPDP